MAIALTVAGVARDFRLESLSIRESAKGQNSCSLRVVSIDGSYRPALHDEIAVVEDGTTIFAGYVTEASESGVRPDGSGSAIDVAVVASDYTQLAARRCFVGTIASGTTLHDALSYIATTYLATYGVTLDATQAAGPTLAEHKWDEVTPINEVLDQLCADAGGATGPYLWEVDYTKKLRAFLPGQTPAGGAYTASFSVTTATTNMVGDITRAPSAADYANRVFVKWAQDGAHAYAYLILIGNAGDGHTVTIGDVTYTWQTTLTVGAGHVLIGASNRASLMNLASAINGTADGATASATPMHTVVWAGAPTWNDAVMTVIARAPGSQQNSTAVATTGSGGWVGDAMAATTTLVNGTDPTLAGTPVQVDDAAEQAAHGLWERILEAPTVYDATAAEAAGTAWLAQVIAESDVVTYTTRNASIHPGMQQTVTVAARGLSGTWFVTDVEIRNQRSNLVERVVSLVKGASIGLSWQDVYRRWAGGAGTGTASGAASVGTTPPPAAATARPAYPLGGDAHVGVRGTAAAWLRVDAGAVARLDSTARGGTAATVTVRLRARAADVTVQARLVDTGDDSVVGTGAVVTSTSWTTDVFAATLNAGAHDYALEVSPGTTGQVVQAMGYVE